ncbi:hypothetical protein YC2023_084566 [Brassica napus]
MKIIVMFLSVIVLVSSGKFIFGAVNTMKISNLEERTHIFSPTATPLMNVQINDLQDEYRQDIEGKVFDRCRSECRFRQDTDIKCRTS